MKRKFRDAVGSNSDVAMVNEVLRKFLAHNLCVLNQEESEIGIAVMFVSPSLTVEYDNRRPLCHELHRLEVFSDVNVRRVRVLVMGSLLMGMYILGGCRSTPLQRYSSKRAGRVRIFKLSHTSPWVRLTRPRMSRTIVMLEQTASIRPGQ